MKKLIRIDGGEQIKKKEEVKTNGVNDLREKRRKPNIRRTGGGGEARLPTSF